MVHGTQNDEFVVVTKNCNPSDPVYKADIHIKIQTLRSLTNIFNKNLIWLDS